MFKELFLEALAAALGLAAGELLTEEIREYRTRQRKKKKRKKRKK